MNFRARKPWEDPQQLQGNGRELLERLLEVTSQLYFAQIPIYAVVVHSELDFNGA